MFEWLMGNATLQQKAGGLYGAVVAAARQPAFYGAGRVSDAPQGRFELVLMHLFLLVERLAKDRPQGEALARVLIETFVADMDDCMREMGVGDLAVPKRVKRAAALFYKRAETYREGLSAAMQEPSDSAVLTGNLRSVLSLSGEDDGFLHDLAGYMVRLSNALAARSYDDIVGEDFSLLAVAEMT